MILQALYDYYQRKAADPESNIAPFGYEWNSKISFRIIIKENGEFLQLEPNTVSYLVPRAVKRSGGNFQANFLWDKEEYILGTYDNDQTKHNIFKKYVSQEIPEQLRNSNGIKAINYFYAKNQIDSIKKSPEWEIVKQANNPIMSFWLVGQGGPIAAHEQFKEFVVSKEFQDTSEHNEGKIRGICSITGDKKILARTHQKTFLNKDANLLVSFQKNSGYDSYKKDQAYNASIGVEAEFAYTTALKMLIQSKNNKFYIRGKQNSGTTILFWADKQNILEENFSFFFNTSFHAENPDRDVRTVKAALESIFTGRLNDEGSIRFYILGLCQGGGSRIAIRIWKTNTVKEFALHIKRHFEDLEIVTDSKFQDDYINLYSLFSNISFKNDIDNLPPNFHGCVIESILDGSKYPDTLQQQCIRRIRAEQDVNRIRAAILKAYLNRKGTIYHTNEKIITMALDVENKNQGYLCGRLFAVLEKIQEDAQGAANIKEKFYGAASSTPITVFSRLVNLSNHHLAKLRGGSKTFYEKKIQEIISEVDSNGLPAHLTLDDQSRFAIGYYHQRLDLFTKKKPE